MFCHLHVHTEYSLLDGMCRIPALVARAKELGMTALAITDHGALHGVIKFYTEARQAGIKPIIGCEFYLAGGDHTSKAPGDKENRHLVLLAKNKTGYQNLIQLASIANLEGFYYKPRVDRELLCRYREGLIALSACPSGEVPRLLLEGRLEEAKQAAAWYKDTFEDFFLELQRQPMPELERINQQLVPLARELDIPLVATADVHYVNPTDAETHDLLLCIGTNACVNDTKRIKMAGAYFYLKSTEEMAALYADVPEAMENSGRIAAMCNLELEFGRLHLPEIDRPAGKTPDEYLAELCSKGLPAVYPQAGKEVAERLAYELEVIKKTEFANYFLVVWDMISFVKKAGILYGVRGSAASSIVLYCLGITALDPIGYRLVFERFLNIERKEMPDIDLDFQDDRRDEVIRYVSEKYGRDHVAQIITFGTLGARAAIRDVGRALGMSYADVDRVARLVPYAPGMTLDAALEQSAELREIYQDSVIKKLVDTARGVEGIARHASTHAAGVVISKEPLTKHTALQRLTRDSGAGLVMTQLPMEDIAQIGLLKMDFLGLANLTIVGAACAVIKAQTGVDVDLHRLPLDDRPTFELLSFAETMGVFQLEGAGMRRYIKELVPTTLSDIAAMVALYRPGPMEQIPRFIRAKHGEEPVTYPHPVLESILQETYGVIVYQEQVLFIAQAFAGYSLGQADILRKAMGKKIPEVMKKEKQRFIAGAKAGGYSSELAGQVFALIEPFAGYAFNKAHAVSYGLLAYQTAYLKANYPVEYMTAFLMTFVDVTEKVATAVAECQRLGIKVLPPDVNRSQVNFSIEKDAGGASGIRFGLAAIKNVGAAGVEPIIAEREKGGEFRSIDDFCRRADLSLVNRRVMESLIKAGALDGFGDRGQLLASLPGLMSAAGREQKRRQTGQVTMFDLFGQEAATPAPDLELAPGTATSRERLSWERELLGVYLSEHPFTPFAHAAAADTTALCGQIDQELEGQMVVAAGMVASVRQANTRDGNPFVTAELEDLVGRVEVIAWPRLYAATRELWTEGNILLVQAKVVVRGDRISLHCDNVRLYQPETRPLEPIDAEPLPPPAPRPMRLRLNLKQTDDEKQDEERLDGIIEILKRFPGEDEVRLHVCGGDHVFVLKLLDIRVDGSPQLRQELLTMLGEEGVVLEEGGA